MKRKRKRQKKRKKTKKRRGKIRKKEKTKRLQKEYLPSETAQKMIFSRNVTRNLAAIEATKIRF